MNRPPISRMVCSVLGCLVAVDVLIIFGDLLREGGVGFSTMGIAIVLIGLCALVWWGISWSKWFLLGFVALRTAFMVKVLASSFGHGEVLRLGAIMVLLIYVFSAVVLVSSIARSNKLGAT